MGMGSEMDVVSWLRGRKTPRRETERVFESITSVRERRESNSQNLYQKEAKTSETKMNVGSLKTTSWFSGGPYYTTTKIINGPRAPSCAPDHPS